MLQSGQMVWTAVDIAEPAGKPFKQCGLMRILIRYHPYQSRRGCRGAQGLQPIAQAPLANSAYECGGQGSVSLHLLSWCGNITINSTIYSQHCACFAPAISIASIKRDSLIDVYWAHWCGFVFACWQSLIKPDSIWQVSLFRASPSSPWSPGSKKPAKPFKRLEVHYLLDGIIHIETE